MPSVHKDKHFGRAPVSSHCMCGSHRRFVLEIDDSWVDPARTRPPFRLDMPESCHYVIGSVSVMSVNPASTAKETFFAALLKLEGL